MKEIAAILCFFLLGMIHSCGQSIDKEKVKDVAGSDSVKAVETLKEIFKSFKNVNFQEFEKISSDSIYCMICFKETDFSDKPYMLNRRDFFDNHLQQIIESDIYQNGKLLKNIQIEWTPNDNFKRSDLIVLAENFKGDGILEEDRQQTGFYMKKVDGNFKFSGIETLP
jgi:hypothetical protein